MYLTFLSQFLPPVLLCFQPFIEVGVCRGELLYLILMKAKYVCQLYL